MVVVEGGDDEGGAGLYRQRLSAVAELSVEAWRGQREIKQPCVFV